MVDGRRARNPFRFCTKFDLVEALGRSACDLRELLVLIREVPPASIYYHTHHYLHQHQYLSPEPPDDFAYWIRAILADRPLAEKLFAMDILEFGSVEELRAGLAAIIGEHLARFPDSAKRTASPGSEFHFARSITFVLPLGLEAWTLNEFRAVVEAVTINSLYYHIFDARLRLGRHGNDFSLWLSEELGEATLAAKLGRLDPYTTTMEGLRQKICALLPGALHA